MKASGTGAVGLWDCGASGLWGSGAMGRCWALGARGCAVLHSSVASSYARGCAAALALTSAARRYSPYHNIDAEIPYPPFLMTTSTRDDRVHPYHARSMVKRLLDVGNVRGNELYYYENMEGGHGGAADSKQQAFMACLYMEFLWKTIGAGYKA